MLLQDQRQWLKDRACASLDYMENKGLTRAQAYTLVTRERWNQLRVALDNLSVPEEDVAQGRGVKPDDYYNANEDGVAIVTKQIPLTDNDLYLD